MTCFPHNLANSKLLESMFAPTLQMQLTAVGKAVQGPWSQPLR